MNYNQLNNLIKINSNNFKKIHCPSKYFLIILLFLPLIFCLNVFIQHKMPINNNNIFKNVLIEINKTTNLNKKNNNSLKISKCIKKEEKYKKEWSLECCEEKMSFTFNLETNNKLTQNMVSGKRFDCSHLQILDKYKLVDKYKIKQKIPVKRPGNKKFIIVTAATDDFFPTLRKLLVILKKKFGCSQKIIGYDLGGISENKNMMEEINSVCNLEWRKFNWNIMPKDVHSPQAYAWKIFILAEIYSKYHTFIWVDTSFTIEDVKSLNPIFESIEKGNISETVFPGNTGHSIHFATNLRTFTYLPIITDWSEKIKNEKWDKNMYEANFIILHKSEHTRKLLKWALLCASTKKCIEPEGSRLFCSQPRTTKGTCHRRDQSAFGIINANLEYQRSLLDKEFIPHFHADHPRTFSKHQIHRYAKLDSNVYFNKEVACCKLP